MFIAYIDLFKKIIFATNPRLIENVQRNTNPTGFRLNEKIVIDVFL